MRGFNHKKAIQALNYFSKKSSGGKINKMKAIKLIWLSDRLHLRQYGRTITGDVYFALPFGPIPSTTRDILEGNSLLSEDELSYSNEYLSRTDKYDFGTLKDPDMSVFSQTDIDIIEKIIEKFGHLKPFELSDLSHSFPEWKKYESALKQKIASRFEIDYNDFFENVSDGSGLFIDEAESLQLTKEIYTENKDILSAF